MRKFVPLNCLVDSNDLYTFHSDAIQNLRQAVLAPAVYKPSIQQALHSAEFRFHRASSFSSLIQV